MSEGTTIKLTEMQCPNCGAKLSHHPNATRAECPACLSSFAVENSAGPKVAVGATKQVFKMYPFTVSREEYQEHLFHWLGEGKHTPNDIYDELGFFSQQAIYLPMYRMQGKYSITYACEAGTKDADKNMVWRSHSGFTDASVDIFGCASKYLDSLPKNNVYPEGFCEKSSMSGSPVEFDTKYTQECLVLDFDLTRDATLAQRGQQQIDNIARDKATAAANKHSGTIRNISHKTEGSLASITPYYLPFWVTVYQYKGQEYVHILNGTSLAQETGTKPEEAERKAAEQKNNRPMNIGCGWFVIWLLVTFVNIFTDLGFPSGWIPVLIGVVPAVVATFYTTNKNGKLIRENQDQRMARKVHYEKNLSDFFARK